MTLTVPKAGYDPGRAPQVAVEAPQSGAAWRGFGQAMQQVGTAIETDRLQRQGQQLQLDLTRDLNNARLEMEQIGDPDTLDQAWPARVAEIRRGYEGRVDARLQDGFHQTFQALADRHAFALGQRGLVLRQGQKIANHAEYRETVIGAAARVDPGTRDTMLAQYDAEVDDRVRDGTYSPEQGQALKSGARSETEDALAIRLVNEDPEGFLELDDAGEFAHLPPSERESRRASAQRNIDAAAEKAAKDRDAAIGKELTRIAAIDDPGRLPLKDRQFLETEAARSHPDYARTAAGVSLADEAAGWRTMPPDALRGLIAEERKRPVTEAWQEQRLALLEEQLAAHEKGMTSDPIGYLAQQGAGVPALPDFDAADPGAFASALAARRDFVSGLGASGWPVPGQMFSAAERTRLQEAAAVTADPGERLALAATLAAGLGERAVGVAAQLTGADPVFAQATGLIAAGASRDTVGDMLAGARRIADKTVTLPSRAEFLAEFTAVTGGRFADQPLTQSRLLESAMAIYAAGPVDEDLADDTAFEAAVNRAMGASRDVDGSVAGGGLQAVRDDTVALPVGISAGAVETALDQLGQKLMLDPGTVASGDLSKADLSILGRISTDGSLPDFGRLGEVRADTLADLLGEYSLEELWTRDGRPSDTYILKRRRDAGLFGGGTWTALPAQGGGNWTISLRKLLRETAE